MKFKINVKEFVCFAMLTCSVAHGMYGSHGSLDHDPTNKLCVGFNCRSGNVLTDELDFYDKICTGFDYQSGKFFAHEMDLTHGPSCHSLGLMCNHHFKPGHTDEISQRLYESTSSMVKQLNNSMAGAEQKLWSKLALRARFFAAYHDATCNQALTSGIRQECIVNSLGTVLNLSQLIPETSGPDNPFYAVYQDSLKLVTGCAQQGDLQAQALLAAHYFQCNGAAQDTCENMSFLWLKKLCQSQNEQKCIELIRAYKLQPVFDYGNIDERLAILKFKALFDDGLQINDQKKLNERLRQLIEGGDINALIYSAYVALKNQSEPLSIDNAYDSIIRLTKTGAGRKKVHSFAQLCDVRILEFLDRVCSTGNEKALFIRATIAFACHDYKVAIEAFNNLSAKKGLDEYSLWSLAHALLEQRNDTQDAHEADCLYVRLSQLNLDNHVTNLLVEDLIGQHNITAQCELLLKLMNDPAKFKGLERCAMLWVNDPSQIACASYFLEQDRLEKIEQACARFPGAIYLKSLIFKILAHPMQDDDKAQQLEQVLNWVKSLKNTVFNVTEHIHEISSWLGRYYVNKGNNERALACLQDKGLTTSRDDAHLMVSLIESSVSLSPQAVANFLCAMLDRAKNGSEFDQRELGFLYLYGKKLKNGQVVQANHALAYELLNEYTHKHQEDADALYKMFILLSYYGGSCGIPDDCQRAQDALNKSLALGYSLDVDGSCILALIHYRKQDYRKALELLEKFLEHPKALLLKGLIKLSLATSDGDDEALTCLEQSLPNIRYCKSTLVGSQELKKSFIELICIAAKKLNKDSRTEFIKAQLYFVARPEYVGIDVDKAYSSILVAVHEGIVSAEGMLAYLYRIGFYVQKNQLQSLITLQKALRKKNIQPCVLQSLMSELRQLARSATAVGVKARYELAANLLVMKNKDKRNKALKYIQQADMLVKYKFGESIDLYNYGVARGLEKVLQDISRSDLKARAVLAQMFVNRFTKENNNLNFLMAMHNIGLPALLAAKEHSEYINDQLISTIYVDLAQRLFQHNVDFDLILNLIKQAYTLKPAHQNICATLAQLLRSAAKQNQDAQTSLIKAFKFLEVCAANGDICACVELAQEYGPLYNSEFVLGQILTPNSSTALGYVGKVISESYLVEIEHDQVVIDEYTPVKILALIALAKIYLHDDYSKVKRLIDDLVKLKSLLEKARPAGYKQTDYDHKVDVEFNALLGLVSVREHRWLDSIKYHTKLSDLQGPSIEVDLQLAIAYLEQSLITDSQQVRLDCYNGIKEALCRLIDVDQCILENKFVNPRAKHVVINIMTKLMVAEQQDVHAAEIRKNLQQKFHEVGIEL